MLSLSLSLLHFTFNFSFSSSFLQVLITSCSTFKPVNWFLSLNTMEAEKANAIRRHNLFSGISKTLRIFEICVVVVLLSWTLTRLPLAVTVSADYLRKLAASPLFIFAVSNAIIAALLAQSGRFSSKNDAHAGAVGIYSEIMNSRVAVADRHEPPSGVDEFAPRAAVVPQPSEAVEMECHDKEVVSETVRDRDVGAGSDLANYRRSQSEKWKGEAGKMLRRRQLRRSETEKRRESAEENLYPQDKLSNEEFQRAIEAFIAKQMRFLREESSAIVLHNSA